MPMSETAAECGEQWLSEVAYAREGVDLGQNLADGLPLMVLVWTTSSIARGWQRFRATQRPEDIDEEMIGWLIAQARLSSSWRSGARPTMGPKAIHHSLTTLPGWRHPSGLDAIRLL